MGLKNMLNKRDLNPLPFGFSTAVLLHVCIMQDANSSADRKSVRHGHNHEIEKKILSTELDIFFSKFYWTEKSFWLCN